MKNTKPNVADAENTHQEKGLNMKNEKIFYIKNKRSYDHLHDFIPCGWYLFVIMTIWGLLEQAPSEIPLFVSVISLFFSFFRSYCISSEKGLAEKHMENYKNSEG